MSTLSSTPNPLRRLATVIAVQITAHPLLGITVGGSESRLSPVDILSDLILDLLTHAHVHIHIEPPDQTDPYAQSEPLEVTDQKIESEPSQLTDPDATSEPLGVTDPKRSE